MGRPLDGKFYGVVCRHKDNEVEPPDSWIVFVARDNALPDTLRFYREKCAEIGAEKAQLDAVDELIRRVDTWRELHVSMTKVPDVDPGELAW